MKLSLSKSEVQTYAESGYTVVPLSVEVLADLETPVSLYLKIQSLLPEAGPFFLLESVEGGEKLGRYSTIGLNPAAVLKIQNNQSNLTSLWPEIKIDLQSNNPYEALNQVLQELKAPEGLHPASFSGLVGALAYDTVRFIEPINLKIDSDFPEAAFVLTGDSITFDNLKRTLRLTTNIYFYSQSNLSESYENAVSRLSSLVELLETDLPSSSKKIVEQSVLETRESIGSWTSSFTQSEFEEVVEVAKEHIRAGDIFQIVLSQQLKIESQGLIEPLQIYRLLRSVNPSPYLFLLDFNEFQLIGSSPEVMVKCDAYSKEKPQQALLRPIAGTYRRGKNEEEDTELAQKLKNDPKELAEHLMLIDLARNDLGRVAIPGSVRPTDLMIVEKYSHVLHLVSEVVCDLKDGMNAVDLLKATFPAGTLSGAPKVRAMQIIAKLEKAPRGFYGGCVGYFGFDGSLNTAMTIRTLLKKGKQIRLQAGAGIVYDSEPSKEYQETLNKGAALLKVIEQSEAQSKLPTEA